MDKLRRIFALRNMGARMAMVIHDAVRIEAPREEAAAAKHVIKRIMERWGKAYLKVPLELDTREDPFCTSLLTGMPNLPSSRGVL